jgi:hypothetical protein
MNITPGTKIRREGENRVRTITRVIKVWTEDETINGWTTPAGTISVGFKGSRSSTFSLRPGTYEIV